MDLRFMTALGVTALLLAGCGSDGTSDDGYTMETPAQEYTSQSAVAMEREALFLTDAEGKSLYTFDNDTLNMSNCTGGCLDIWPIFYAPNSEGEQFAALPDNAMHAALLKHPLYYYFDDNNPGDTNGDWVNGVWHLVYAFAGLNTTDEVKLSTQAHTQKFVADDRGRSLYTFDNDTPDVSNCSEESGCLGIWPVFYADVETMSLPEGVERSEFGEIARDDGLKQVTYQHKPLYYFASDTQAGDTNGDWVNGVWHLVELEPEAMEAPVSADLEAGQEKFSNTCAVCHGDDGKTPALGKSIKIGEVGDAVTLEGYLRNMKDNGIDSGKDPIMVNIAQGLGDDEIVNLSAYIATLK